MHKTGRIILAALVTGFALDLVVMFAGTALQGSAVIEFLGWLASPVAHLLSYITGWSLHHESGMLLYFYAILITIPLLCLLIFGLIATINHYRKNNKQSI